MVFVPDISTPLMHAHVCSHESEMFKYTQNIPGLNSRRLNSELFLVKNAHEIAHLFDTSSLSCYENTDLVLFSCDPQYLLIR